MPARDHNGKNYRKIHQKAVGQEKCFKPVGRISYRERLREKHAHAIKRASRHLRCHSRADEADEPRAECGESKARDILVAAEGDGEETVDQSAECRHQKAENQRKHHRPESGNAFHSYGVDINSSADDAARAAHAHDAGDAEVEVARLFRDRFAHRTEEEYRAEANRPLKQSKKHYALTSSAAFS